MRAGCRAVGRSLGVYRRAAEQVTIAGVFADHRFIDVLESRREVLVRPWSGERRRLHRGCEPACPPESMTLS